MGHDRRGFKGGAKATTLNGGINNSVTTIPAVDLSTWAGVYTNGFATATINEGLSDEEVVTFTGISGNSLTGVTRGQGGTSAQAHASGTVQHTSQAVDFDEANEIVSGLSLCGARVYNDAAISIPTSTVTTLTFNQERYDTGALHSTSVNTSRLTAPRAGKYMVTANVEFAANATGYRQMYVVQNAVNIIASDLNPVSNASVVTHLCVSTLIDLAAADYMEVVVAQTSGGALNVNSVARFSPEFAMQWMAP